MDLSIAAADLVPDVLALPPQADRVPPEIGFEVATRAGSERAWATVDASLAHDPASVPALTFAAGVAEFDRDDRRAAELLEQALRHTDEPWVHHSHADALLAAGDLGSALPEIERLCSEDPGDGNCCGPVEDAALERFRERLEMFLDLLRDLGETPEVVDETRVDPAQDLVLTRGPRGPLLAGGSPEAHDAWARAWPDVPVPALDGLTPREAATDADLRPRLEGLLREFEFMAGNLRRAGEAGPDIAAARADVGMEDPYAWSDRPDDVIDVERLDRRAWAVPLARGRLGGIERARLDPNDPDERGLLIRAEHPELEKALKNDLDEVRVGGHDVNPRLHLALHEAIANQLWEDDPPEVWQTAKRLLRLGYERHEILHMLASAMSQELWEALREGKPYDHARHVRSLQALPGGWEAAGRRH